MFNLFTIETLFFFEIYILNPFTNPYINYEYLAHSEPLFKTLKLLKIDDLYKLKLLKFYYNLSYNILPPYFNFYIVISYMNHVS